MSLGKSHHSATLARMSHPSHRRSHQRAHPARSVQSLIIGSFIVVGLALVIAIYFTPGPIALALLLCAVAVPLLIAGAVVCCVTGRFAAGMTNLVRLCCGYASLEKIAQEARDARDAREANLRNVA
jgi:hypothetical protein